MIWPLRRQLPVYSPLSARSIAGAVGAALGGSGPGQSLEERLRERHGAREVVLVDSGTSALALAMRAAGGPVAIPAFCCFDVATACDGAMVAPILYDLDPRTLAPEPESLARALAAGVRAVVVVHLYGIPVPITKVRAQAEARGALVIEDAAQATGAWISGRRAGGLGSFGVLSFGRGKGVTGGGGGALLLNDDEAVARYQALEAPIRPAAKLPPHAVTATVAQWLLARPSVYGLPASLPFLRLGETIYYPPHPVGEISAFSRALAAISLEGEDVEAQVRRQNAETLLKALAGASDELRPVVSAEPLAQPGYLKLPVSASGPWVRLRGGRAARLGILPSYPTSLAGLTGFRERLGRGERMKGAEWLAHQLVTFPTHGRLGNRDLEAMRRLVAPRLVPAYG